ncbi:MAG: malto-oligosyltrehalose trehalohydrolase [Candidatus Omnitrophota bacterium]
MRIHCDYRSREEVCNFSVWAPFLDSVILKIVSPYERDVRMEKNAAGYWRAQVPELKPGALYYYRLNDTANRPDPASLYQPQDVHGPSCVIDLNAFDWRDSGWKGIPLSDLIMYELHIGAFTPEGTFAAAGERTDDLKILGVNALEVMPIAQFPGERNWGYDGTYPYSVNHSYGGPAGFRNFVNVCHAKGMAVILDVVYNHLGPEGSYLAEFGPYFTEKYRTPWGSAVNFDDAYSDHVRNFFIENALFWFTNYHVDALRLDAVHGIYDFSAKHILEELTERVEELSGSVGRKLYLIAESDLNDTRIIRKRALGGYGIHAQWCDDFHHAVHTILTGEETGYYCDFGTADDLVRAIRDGFVYSGQYSAFRKRRHGTSSSEYPPDQFIVSIQNHDQTGNRMRGERLSHLLSFEALKVASGILLTSPYIPLLFMGEEYAETAPFLYFVSHADSGLIEAVRSGRKREFSSFGWKEEPPDPQDKDTFTRSKLHWELRGEKEHGVLLRYYRKLIRLRKEIPALRDPDRKNFRVFKEGNGGVIVIERASGESAILCFINSTDAETTLATDFLRRRGRKMLDSSDAEWMGAGSSLPEIIEPKKKFKLQPYTFSVFDIGRKA